MGTSTAPSLSLLYLSDVELFRAQGAIGGVDDLWISKRGGSVSESGMRNRCCSNPLHFTQAHDMIRFNHLQTHSRGPGWKIPRRVKGEKGKVHRTELQKPSRSGGPLYHRMTPNLPDFELRCPLHARRSISRSSATPWPTDDESIAAVPVAGGKVENELFSKRFRGRKVVDSEHPT